MESHYNPATASTDLGVPLKISSGVEHDKDKDTQFERTTLDKIYRQLADDLTRSVACLKQEVKVYCTGCRKVLRLCC